MNAATREIASMLDMLPEQEQLFACEVMKKLILAWDPDFTKLTAKEASDLELARAEFARGETVNHEDINWDDYSKICDVLSTIHHLWSIKQT
jgi:hypothetical protein